MAEKIDTLYLSPHFDDVALSCPARLRDERAEGKRVLVLTIFSRGDSSHQAREAEDALALKLLDVEGAHSGLLDAPVRNARYRSLSALCLQRTPFEVAERSSVEQAVSGAIARFEPSQILAPLGVGGHVDHRLVHEAARARVPLEQLCFYEDRPYALVRGAVERRLRELGANIDEPSTREHLRAFLAAPYVRSYLRPRDLIHLARHLRRSAPSSPQLEWIAAIERHPLGERGAAIAAGLAYVSQWKELFGTLGDHERLLREESERLGAPEGYAERFWRIAS